MHICSIHVCWPSYQRKACKETEMTFEKVNIKTVSGKYGKTVQGKQESSLEKSRQKLYRWISVSLLFKIVIYYRY